jgi:hypothetical protein
MISSGFLEGLESNFLAVSSLVISGRYTVGTACSREILFGALQFRLVSASFRWGGMIPEFEAL